MRLGIAAQPGGTPSELPGFEMLGSLGRGGMGEVFRAQQLSLGREVAVKFLRADLPSAGWMPERFENEARTMAALRHPNLVTVHDCVRLDNGSVAIVMELVDGGSLRRHLAAGGLPLAQALAWARDIAEGLRAAHSAGIVHRDVKPENVLIDTAERARVTDFGMAFSISESARLTQTGAAIGTVGYMAPEQLRGEPADARADVFSFGVLLYEMLTGRLPQGSFSPAGELRPEVPQAIDTFIQAALRPERERRPADMAAFLCALDARPRLITRRRAIAAGVAAAAGAGGWFAMRDREAEWQRFEWPKDPGAVAICGGWRVESGVLISDEEIAIVPIARRMPMAFDVRLRFTRLSGDLSIGVFFRTPRGTAVCTLAARGKNLGGVQMVSGLTLEQAGAFEMPLENGRAYEWHIELRPTRVRMWVDGELKNERDIAGQPLAVPETWAWTPGVESPALLLGSWKSATRFEWCEWRAGDANFPTG